MSDKGERMEWEAFLALCPECGATVSCFAYTSGKTVWATCPKCGLRFVARYGREDD